MSSDPPNPNGRTVSLTGMICSFLFALCVWCLAVHQTWEAFSVIQAVGVQRVETVKILGIAGLILFEVGLGAVFFRAGISSLRRIRR